MAYVDLSTGGCARLAGALAPAVVVDNSETARERILVAGCASIAVRAKAAITSDPTVQVVAQRPGVPGDDTTVTNDATAGLTSATNLSNNAEVIHEYTLKGEQFVDVVITSDSGDVATITYVDVFVKPL